MEQSGEDHKNIVEWIVFVLSLTAVVSLLGLFTFRAFTHDSGPAEIVLEYREAPAARAPFRYHVSIENVGGQTAEKVLIELTLQTDGKVVDRAQLEIPYVPKTSKREGWIHFSTDPASADKISARVVSYHAP